MSMDNRSELDSHGDTSVDAIADDAYRLRSLGTDFVGASDALETILRSGDVRLAYGASKLVADWALKLSQRATCLRDSIIVRAREEAERFLEDTTG